MEKSNPQEFRDRLAKDVKKIQSHEKRVATLNELRFKAERARSTREHFRETPEYINNVKPIIDSDKNALEKIFLASKYYLEFKKYKGYRLDIFSPSNPAFSQEFFDNIVEELKSEIQTSEQLDAFLAELLLRFRSLNEELFNDLSFDDFVGHFVIKTLLNPIREAFVQGRPKTKENIDWWYTLGRHLYMSSYVASSVSNIYKKNILDSRSKEYRNYLLSKGYDIK